MTSMSSAQLNWLAGLLEGEGCFSQHTKKWKRPRITLQMVDEDVVRRAHEVSGIGSIQGPYQTGHQPVWRWQVGKQAEAAGLMMTLYPLLGQRRQEKIRSILLDWRKR